MTSPSIPSYDVLRQRATALWDALPAEIFDLAQRFADAGHEFALVGGPVRDAFLGRSSADLDFATSARPDATEKILKTWTRATWDVGRDFGTIGGRRNDLMVEITTYRADEYDGVTRKPVVAFGDSLDGDLARRDFTINAMAVKLPSKEFIDLHGGLEDLAGGLLRTPIEPDVSFADDPLRMMRAARFASQLGFEIEPATFSAMNRFADRLSIVSAERVRDELCKLLLGANPRIGLTALVDAGLSAHVLPELPALQLEVDEHHHHKDVYEHTLTVLDQAIDLETDADGPVPGPDLILRLAAIMHDIGKPPTKRLEPGGGVSFHHHEVVGAKMTRKRMKELRFDKDTIKAVSHLVELHLRFHGYADARWSDSAVRRYVTDAGDQLERLHRLTRADVTTRNRRKADRLSFAYDDLEQRIAELREQEEIDSIRPDLDGNQIMEALGIGPGREIGMAYKYLLELRMEHGPLGEERALTELKAWWADQQ
ncbi:CCA tRNA nucleotidyltransferase [Demequina sp. B12]|uniref:CCA tRNA nucleotidyltransferase n=1 Tax=Demequina sp. B12 TaxID=2992757 RepID=UPI00237AFF78|nr:CCA tRNA nucleotidyltransferase [Demequina sp. B12]MDE0572142.1 CCA tRNA nucleotidyltransferase [Demequina sp. B12]